MCSIVDVRRLGLLVGFVGTLKKHCVSFFWTDGDPERQSDGHSIKVSN